MIPALIVFGYLFIVLYIGIFAFRKGKGTGEDFFLASRTLGPVVFLLSIFGTNMTAFAILGSSGLAYQRGIGVYGLMASSSGIVIPLTILFIGTRLWALGKRFGHMTQVQFLRDRWECGGIGTFISLITAAMLVPYIIIGVMGGGTTLEAISTYQAADGSMRHWVSYEVGGAVVAIVVMSYVFFGGMRGTAWVNTFQTALFLCFGTLAFVLIARSLGGFGGVMETLAANPRTAALLGRDRIPQAEFFSYMFIPLSAIMFPHISIMCLTAEKVTHFKRTVIFYPLCIAAIWVPSVYLGVVAAEQFPGLRPGEADDVIIRMLNEHTPTLVAGILGAGIMACVMASDSQILALGTIFTEDLFAYYGGRKRFGEKAEVWAGRTFVVLITITAYLIALALKDKEGIFELAIRFAFSGFAALAPVMLGALFWKRSTKWGALAASVWVAACVLGIWWMTSITDAKAAQHFAAPRPATRAAVPPPSPSGNAPAPSGNAPSGNAPAPSANAPAPSGNAPSGNAPAPSANAPAPSGNAPSGNAPAPSANAPAPSGNAPAPAGTAPGATPPGGSGGAGAARRPGPPPADFPVFPELGNMFLRGRVNVTVYGFLPVMPMVLGSALLMVLVSLLTRPPSRQTLDRYFPASK